MTEDADGRDEKRPRRRAPRKVTREYLENVALWYLGRFAATSRSLEQVLMRRVWRSARHHGTDPAEGKSLIAAIIARYREAGLLDDAAFARARAATLHGRGLPLRAIAQKLRQKGLSSSDIEAAVTALAEDSDMVAGDTRALDLAAARAYARRRRLGPWRAADRRSDMRERDLAALARAGFSYGTAREVIDGSEDG